MTLIHDILIIKHCNLFLLKKKGENNVSGILHLFTVCTKIKNSTPKYSHNLSSENKIQRKEPKEIYRL